MHKAYTEVLTKAVDTLNLGFADLPNYSRNVDASQIEPIIVALAEKMQDNYPYEHPLYAGQMLKPPHPVARIAYSLAMLVNPNNHALDGGRASSALEKEAVAAIAAMFGWQAHLGHLCGGGTMANLEALWVASKCHPGKTVLASEQAHYTHSRITEVLGIPFDSVATDQHTRMDLAALKARLSQGDVGTVVVTLGTTGTGAVDPLNDILALKDEFGFRVHIDAAYGGYFKLASNLAGEAAAAFAVIEQADSIVIDPHKHGLQPYGCGCVVFADPEVGRFYKHDSPYTYFSSAELHLGEISLECSRPGAAAAALWATQQLLPQEPRGEFAQGIEQARAAALGLYTHLQQSQRERTLFEPQLDIVVWAPHAESASATSALSAKLFEACASEHLHLALMKLPASLLKQHWPDMKFDQDTVSCLRSCLMKPEHAQWLPKIIEIYEGVRHAH